MIIAQIIDTWVVNGNEYTMKLSTKYAEGYFFDSSDQPIAPDTPVIVEAVVEDSIYDDILTDADYGEGAILWSEVVSDGE